VQPAFCKGRDIKKHAAPQLSRPLQTLLAQAEGSDAGGKEIERARLQTSRMPFASQGFKGAST
jgi:hypothetical protein